MDNLKSLNSMKAAQDQVKGSQVLERRGFTEAIDNSKSKCAGILIVLMEVEYQSKSA